MNINQKEIRKQLERVISQGWLPWFQEAAKRADTSTAHFLAIGSRETNLRNIRGDFRGGQYHGFGVMQVDIGTDPGYARNWTPDAVEPSIRRGGDIYSEKVDSIVNGQGRRLKVRGYAFTGCRVEPDDTRRIATAAYNCGLWSYLHFSRNEHVDSTTTGHDYSRDVYDRSIEFAALLQERGIEPNALEREVSLQGKYATQAAQRRAGVAEPKETEHADMAEPLEDQSVLVRADARNHPEGREKIVKSEATSTETTTAAVTAAPEPTAVVEIKKTEPAESPILKGIKTHYAAAAAFITSAGGGAIAMLKGLPPALIYGFFGAAAFIACVYILSRVWLRNQENSRQLERDRMAHELTLAQLKTAADRNSVTVKVT